LKKNERERGKSVGKDPNQDKTLTKTKTVGNLNAKKPGDSTQNAPKIEKSKLSLKIDGGKDDPPNVKNPKTSKAGESKLKESKDNPLAKSGEKPKDKNEERKNFNKNKNLQGTFK